MTTNTIKGSDFVESDIQYADADDVREYAANIKPAWFICRERGHNMLDHDAWQIEEGLSARVLRCTRCRTTCEQVVDAEGEVLTTKGYKYPKGYQLPKGTGRIAGASRGVFRLANMERSLVSRAERGGRKH